MAKGKTITSWILLILGLLIIFTTHIYMLVMGGIPEAQMTMHAVLNLIGGGLIVVYKIMESI